MARSNRQYSGMKAGSPDEFQTEPAAIDFLAPYIPNNWIVWEPACGKGNMMRALGLHLINGHISGSDIIYGQDFMETKPPDGTNAIVTNPPFSRKENFMGRCYNLGLPFALLMPITTFDSVERRSLMDEFGVEVIMPPRRIKFETPNHQKRIDAGQAPGSAWFYSAWFTWGFNIGKQLTFIK